MKTKLFTFLFLISLSHFAFGQDPNCHYLIVLNQIETEKYEYRIFLEDQGFEEMPFEFYYREFTSSGFPNNSEMVKANNGKKLVLIQEFHSHCFANQKYVLRVVIGRKNKKTSEIELMYTEKPVEESYTEIIFKKFKAGNQKPKISRSYSFFDTHSYEN